MDTHAHHKLNYVNSPYVRRLELINSSEWTASSSLIYGVRTAVNFFDLH